MRTDLLQAISYQEDVVRFTQNTDDYYFSVDRLTINLEGRLAKAYHEATSISIIKANGLLLKSCLAM